MAIVKETDMHPNFAGGIPESKGIPLVAKVVGVVTLIGIFAVGTGTVLFAGWGHVWPSAQSQRIDLTK